MVFGLASVNIISKEVDCWASVNAGLLIRNTQTSEMMKDEMVPIIEIK